MATNVNAPFGFSPEGTLGGGNPNFRLSRRLIASTNSTKIFTGDLVVDVSSSVTGYIAQAAASPSFVCGVFWGCKYLSTSQGRTVWSRYWPGADATGDVTAYVIDNPDALFTVQSDTTGIVFANLNTNVNITVNAGSTVTGQSGMVITGPANTSTLPMIVYDFVQTPTGAVGTDITTGFNYVIVGFNTSVFKSGITAVS